MNHPDCHLHRPSEGAHRHDDRGAGRLAWTLGFIVLYMVVEVVGGLLSGSLALLADAGHMFSDAASLALALFAARVARRAPTVTHTFGWYRAEILAALANGALLVAVALFVGTEAVGRLGSPHEVKGPLMTIVAAGGLLVNLASLKVLGHGHEEASLNERGARLHVLFDAIGSVQALLAGGAVWALGWQWFDPVASLVIAVLVVVSAWSLLRESVAVLMESAPAHLDIDRVREAMAAVPGVCEVHDLHVWTITSGLVALSAHVQVGDGVDVRAVLAALRRAVREGFGVHHLTIEVAEGPCEAGHGAV